MLKTVMLRIIIKGCVLFWNTSKIDIDKQGKQQICLVFDVYLQQGIFLAPNLVNLAPIKTYSSEKQVVWYPNTSDKQLFGLEGQPKCSAFVDCFSDIVYCQWFIFKLAQRITSACIPFKIILAIKKFLLTRDTHAGADEPLVCSRCSSRTFSLFFIVLKNVVIPT